MSTHICPYCFNTIDASKVYFYCENPNCEQDDWERTEFELDRPLINENEVQSHRTVFQIQHNFLLNWLRIKPPHDINCPYCQTRTPIRACPSCHSPFPCGIDNLSNMVIAIIGEKNAGKSSYIAVLIQRIKELYAQFGWSFVEVDDVTAKRYNQLYYKPLYEEGRTVNATQPAISDPDGQSPLMYSLHTESGHKIKTITLAFFDTAGDDFRDDGVVDMVKILMRLCRYIYKASGIIMLFDPLQIPEIHEQVDHSEISSPNNANAGSIINRVAQMIYRGQNLHHSKKINIPLAAVCSKIDLLKEDILGAASPVYQPSRHNGYFDLPDFQNNNDYIRDWIAMHDKQFIEVMSVFTDSAFFGVSALGVNPDVISRPRPIRVEDPLLWLLWKNGFIKGK